MNPSASEFQPRSQNTNPTNPRTQEPTRIPQENIRITPNTQAPMVETVLENSDVDMVPATPPAYTPVSRMLQDHTEGTTPSNFPDTPNTMTSFPHTKIFFRKRSTRRNIPKAG